MTGGTWPASVRVEPGALPLQTESPDLVEQQNTIAAAQATQAAAQFATTLPLLEQTRDNTLETVERLPATGAASEITQLGVFGQVTDINEKLPFPQPVMGSTVAIPVTFLNGPQVGAAGSFRVASSRAIFDAKHITDAQNGILWDDQQTSGSGTSSTHSAATASVLMSVSNLTAGTRIRQTLRRLTYQAGKGQLVLMTGVLGTPATGIVREMGQHDGSNGVFFVARGVTDAAYPQSGVYVVVRSATSGSVVDTAVHQSFWKEDRMDGTGPSGITINWDMAQLFVIDYQWLSLGQIRFGLKLGGRIHYVHTIESENQVSVPWASTPHLPLRCLISNDGTGPAASLRQICSAIFTEDGLDEIGYSFTFERTTPIVTGNDLNLYPLIAIRLKSTHFGSTVRPKSISLVASSNTVFRWSLFVNPTVAGAAFSWTDMTYTSIQIDKSRTATTTLTVPADFPSLAGGIVQQRDEGSLIALTSTAYALGSTISGTPEVLVLAVQRLEGTAETIYGALTIGDQQ